MKRKLAVALLALLLSPVVFGAWAIVVDSLIPGPMLHDTAMADFAMFPFPTVWYGDSQ